VIIIIRLPNLSTSQPASGIAIKEPTGLLNNKPPSSPSLKPSCSFISGIREAQLAKHKPVIKKNALSAILLLIFIFIYSVKAQLIIPDAGGRTGKRLQGKINCLQFYLLRVTPKMSVFLEKRAVIFN
jgi:hypothetical protein